MAARGKDGRPSRMWVRRQRMAIGAHARNQRGKGLRRCAHVRGCAAAWLGWGEAVPAQRRRGRGALGDGRWRGRGRGRKGQGGLALACWLLGATVRLAARGKSSFHWGRRRRDHDGGSGHGGSWHVVRVRGSGPSGWLWGGAHGALMATRLESPVGREQEAEGGLGHGQPWRATGVPRGKKKGRGARARRRRGAGEGGRSGEVCDGAG